MGSSVRFGGFSSSPFGTSFLGGQTRAFLVLCFLAGVFCSVIWLNLRYRHEAHKPYLYDADDDFGFIKFLRIRIWL